MDIVYASDNNFAWIMGISILSLMENNKNASEIHFHILDGGIDDDNKNKLFTLIHQYNRNIVFYDIYDIVKTEMGNKKAPRGSIMMFARLFINRILPVKVKKALYIDCDTLILDSLEELWNTGFDNNVLIAINDCVSNAHRKWIYLPENVPYFNSGVLFIDMERWRIQNMDEKINAATERFPKGGPYGDQCILNLALSSNTKLVHPKYNCLPFLWKFSYSELMKVRTPSVYYSEQEIREAVASPVIVHFATFFYSIRPWIEHPTDDVFCIKWRQYLTVSPWGNHKLWKDKRTFISKLFVKIFNFPINTVLHTTGLLHSKIRPFIGTLLDKL
jgi:lipopolysaccharide biosynthesis glycosyltransferase